MRVMRLGRSLWLMKHSDMFEKLWSFHLRSAAASKKGISLSTHLCLASLPLTLIAEAH